MIYVTKDSINLLVYHLYKTYGYKPKFIKDANEVDLIKAISTMGEIGLEEITNYVSIVEYKYNNVPSLKEHSMFNDTYIHISNNVSDWEGCTHLKLDPCLYKPKIMGNLFLPDAVEYFWEDLCLKKFKCNPFKWYVELNSLLVNKKSLYTLTQLKEIYEVKAPNTINSFLLKLGTREAFNIIPELSDSDLWVLMMGNKPYIYHYLIDKNNAEDVYSCVCLIQELVHNCFIDIRRAVYILNAWFVLYPLERGYKYIKMTSPISELKEFLNE